MSNTSVDVNAPALAVAPEVWAKSDPFHSLAAHMLDVGAACLELLPIYGGVAGLDDRWVAVFVALHDIGKAEPHFQAKAPELFAQLAPEFRCPSGLNALASEVVRRIRHEAVSERLVADWLGQLPGWTRAGRRLVTSAIRQHHGYPPTPLAQLPSSSALPPDDVRPLVDACWTKLREPLMAAVLTAFAPPTTDAPSWTHHDVSGVRLAALTVLSDWIASNISLYVPPGPVVNDPRAYVVAARGRAALAIDRVGLRATVPRGAPRPLPRWEELWPDRSPPRPMQAALVKQIEAGAVPPGLVILEAPMGVGKTEAAIYLAEAWNRARGLDGLYFALPTQATSNQLYRRYRAYLTSRGDGAAARLVHGMAWLVDAEPVPSRSAIDVGGDADATTIMTAAEEAAAWLRNARRALLAPHAVGTIDQVLMAALRVRFGALRWLGLANKVLVVDEVHACDGYMRRRLRRVLEWCRAMELPVVLLSATLPSWQRDELLQAYGAASAPAPMDEGQALPYPLLTTVSGRDGSTRELTLEGGAKDRNVELTFVDGAMALDSDASLNRVVALAIERTMTGGCACVILNTVAHAQAVFARLSATSVDYAQEPKLLLFHARFPAWRRAELERELEVQFGERGDRPTRAIVVATQVVEQSLDVDFDVLVTQLAPMDLILQRTGRVWRHDRPVPRPTGTAPQLIVLGPAMGDPVGTLGSSRRVYGTLGLLRSAGLLHNRRALVLPSDIRPLVEAAYDTENTPVGGIPIDALAKALAEDRAARRADDDAAGRYMIGAPDPTAFRYPSQGTVDEAVEDEPADWRHATTRLDDGHSTSVLLLAREGDRQAFEEACAGRPVDAASLMACRVSVPAWWLTRCPDQLHRAPVSDATFSWLRHLPAVVPEPWNAGREGAITWCERLGVFLPSGATPPAGASAADCQ